MSSDLLAAVGVALYGPRWKTDLARDLGVTYRTLQRWCVDGSAPGHVFNDLRRVVGSRAQAVLAARKLLWSGRL